MRMALLVSLVLCSCGAATAKKSSEVPPHLRSGNAATPGVLEVRVSGVPSVEGQLYVELYDATTYFHYDQVLNERIVPVSAQEMSVRLEHVPPGRYIVAVSHDRNSNNILDTGIFGIPKEAYGFSRDARGTFGPPSFADGAFDFDGTTASMPVRVR